MKKIIVLIGCYLTLNSFLLAQTNVPAGDVSGTWTITSSPYLVNGAINIPNASTLIIEPGVSVIFQGVSKLQVYGKLLAIGTATDSIRFFAQDINTDWSGIRFVSGSGLSKMFYCKLSGAKNLSGNGGALYFGNSSTDSISYCLITNNYADAGGGIYFDGSSNPIFSHNTVSNNTAQNGGGIYSLCGFCSGGPTIIFNLIDNNSATAGLGDGGGIFFDASSITTTFTNNTVSNNNAMDDGGGIYCVGANVIIKNNTISNNNSNSSGGGIYTGGNYSNDGPDITGNIINGNTANTGGGIEYGGNDTISNNTISNNSAAQWGSGIYTGSGIIFRNVISNNNGSGSGGGIYANANPSIIQNIIVNNTTTAKGGGICFWADYDYPTFINNTICNNYATQGGGFYCAGNSDPTLKNSILWGNTATEAGNQVCLGDNGSDPTFQYCNLQGGKLVFGLVPYSVFELDVYYTGTYQNNIDSDPLFQDPTSGSGTGYDGASAVWYLQSGSPCINTGDPTGPYISTDIMGDPRVINGVIDMGPFEYQGTTSIITNCSGSFTDGSGSSDYNNNSNYKWLIHPSDATSITLSFTSFNTEESNDIVRVYDGTTPSASLLGYFSGSVLPNPLTSTSGNMLVSFITNGSLTSTGWSTDYSCFVPIYCSGTDTTKLTNCSGSFEDGSGSKNYNSNTDCMWLIQPPNTSQITLSFSSFVTESSWDVVKVYDGNSTSSPLIGSFSGSSIPPQITSTGGSIFVHFTSDGSITMSGWSANYSCSSCKSTTTLTDCSGSFDDGSGLNDYRDDSDCKWLIQPSGATSITLSFLSFNTESNYDFIEIFDGATISDISLGKFSGSSLPLSVTSTGGKMLVLFSSDGSSTRSGWSANYSCNYCSGTTTTLWDCSGSFNDGSGLSNYSANSGIPS